MNVTATLFGQMITFVIFVWFIKAYLWEPLINAMDERTNKISEGLASAELGQKKIESAKSEYIKIVEEAKVKAADVINLAQQQSNAMIDDANNRFNDKISGLEGYVKRELDTLEDRLNEKLTKALENPLAI